MADNVEITAGVGTTIRTDQLSGGQHVQYVKLMSGSADSEELIRGGSAFGLQVDARRLARLFSTATLSGSGAISASVSAGSLSRFSNVFVHLSASPSSSGSLTITLDAVSGSEFDVRFASQSMVGLTDYLYFPGGDFVLATSDVVKVEYTNPDSRMVGVGITIETVN